MSKCLYVVDRVSHLYTLDCASASANVVGRIASSSTPPGESDVVRDIAFHGPTLYGVGTPEWGVSQFLRLNPDRGVARRIGAIGFETSGLSVDTDGIIYAGTTDGQLITINPVTGAGTVLGNFGDGLTFRGDLAFDSNDRLYGTLNQGGTDVLAEISRTTGDATVIGPTNWMAVLGLAFFCGRLYGVTHYGATYDGGYGTGELAHINVATGQATVIGRNSLSQWGMAARPCCGCCCG